MAAYTIEFAEEAARDIDRLPAFQRKLILSAVRAQLSDEPTRVTRNRKRLRQMPLARWELRRGDLRIFYDVDRDAQLVTILAVARKRHGRLYFWGREVDL